MASDKPTPENPDDQSEGEAVETPGGIDQEPVERRSNVGTTTPEQYPKGDRAKG